MTPKVSQTYWLKDYEVCDYLMSAVELTLDLTQKPVQSKASLTIRRNPKSRIKHTPLILDGEHMILTALSVNGTPLSPQEYVVSNSSLKINKIFNHASFTVEMTCLLGECTDLFGLYETDGIYLVKAETQGLRRVFYCIDRPDNLAIYTTTIIAEQQKYPTLLSNGLLVNSQVLACGHHKATWLDNLAKPSYLFALVAGNLAQSSTLFKTKSGRQLPIRFYVPSEDLDKCHFAQDVLKLAMAWDERVYKLECDLPQHMIAGVDKYASGASEPTGLNLFNTENLFATAQSKTDVGILRVLEVVAHEFFHYWSGNRVTIRDWFNLPFKEGLTTFRADMFREELFGSDVVRLLDNKKTDPRAPRQKSYTAIRSLYTAAAYEKSADIFRMIMNMLGEDLFHHCMSQFLRDRDGDAVTLEEVLNFLSSMSSIDVTAFLSWFTQSGIPQVHITDHYDAALKQYVLSIHVVGGKSRPIPLLIGLLSSSGEELVSDHLLMLDKPEMEFHFNEIHSKPTPSLFRNFSAPVILCYEFTTEQLILLFQNDTCLYNRCQAAHSLIKNKLSAYCNDVAIELDESFFNAYRTILSTKSLSPWLLAELLSLPSEDELFASLITYDCDMLSKGLSIIKQALADKYHQELQLLLQFYKKQTTPYALIHDFDMQQAGIRRLSATCFSYLQYVDYQGIKQQLIDLFKKQLGVNMTETVNALNLLAEMNCDEFDELLGDYYHYWQDDPHAINYWFTVQASIHRDVVITRVHKLIHHEAFDILNPNNVYALLSPFTRNPYGFHNKSGKGYQLMAQVIIHLDGTNPPLAANFMQKFAEWQVFDAKRQYMMIEQIKLIAKKATSVDVKNSLDKIYQQNPEHFNIESKKSIPLDELKPE